MNLQIWSVGTSILEPKLEETSSARHPRVVFVFGQAAVALAQAVPNLRWRRSARQKGFVVSFLGEPLR